MPKRTSLRFVSDDAGNVGMIFGLCMIPVMACVGAAVDYGRAVQFREQARSTGDSVAVAIAASDLPTGFADKALASAKASLQAKYGADLSGLSIGGTWLDNANYKVTIGGSLKAFILPAVPGMPKDIPVAIETVVKAIPPIYETLPPKLSQLSPEAADYNRLYIYCYNPARKTDPDKGRRLITAIADNGTPGLDYSKNKMPTCKEGEYISYKLRNVRNVRASPSKWDASGQQVYEYYTDTTIDPNTGVQKNTMTGARVYDNGTTSPIDMINNPILETILCDTEAKCRPKSEGGILPNNHETGRTPQTASGACSEGKLMYFGWEDRPPSVTSDRDYDDIRLIVHCPKRVKVQDKHVKIVK
jgi:hypothetical protein